MIRPLKIILLAMLVIQSFFLPVQANVYGQGCPFIIYYSTNTLPATDITDTAVTLNGEFAIELVPTGSRPAGDVLSPFVFDYGTAPGVYTETVASQMVGTSMRADGRIRVSEIFRGRAEHLRPCTRYYARFRFPGVIIGPSECVRYTEAGEISFTTAGCRIIAGNPTPHGAGGFSLNGSLPNQPLNLSNIIVSGAALDETRVAPGEKVNVTATVANRGGSNGTAMITMYVNGQEEESRGITVAGGQSAPVVFTVSRNEPGTYTVYVGDTQAGSFTVDAFTNNDILIYGIIVLFVLGITGALFLITRKQRA